LESKEDKAIRRGAALIGSATLALVVGLVTPAFQIAGIIDMAMAHLLMALAWFVAVISICLLDAREYGIRFKFFSALIVSVLLGGLDIWMVRKRAERDMVDAQPRLSVENEKAPNSFISQDNQAAPPKVHRFARIKVAAEGKSVANVRAFVSKIKGKRFTKGDAIRF
jgi:hypothetical protein